MKINDTKNTIYIGPKSTKYLNDIGIFTKLDLEEVGPVLAFVRMSKECKGMKPSLNLLYGLVAVVENVHWRDVAKNEKGRLLMELEGYKEMAALFNEQ